MNLDRDDFRQRMSNFHPMENQEHRRVAVLQEQMEEVMEFASALQAIVSQLVADTGLALADIKAQILALQGQTVTPAQVQSLVQQLSDLDATVKAADPGKAAGGGTVIGGGGTVAAGGGTAPAGGGTAVGGTAVGGTAHAAGLTTDPNPA